MRLYVGNLNPRAENRDLEDAFKDFLGKVKHQKVPVSDRSCASSHAEMCQSCRSQTNSKKRDQITSFKTLCKLIEDTI